MPWVLSLRCVASTSSTVTALPAGGSVTRLLALSTSSPLSSPLASLPISPPAGEARRLGDVPMAEGGGVEDVFVAAADQHHRVGGRELVELLRGRQPLLLELRLVPVVVADDDACRARASLARTPDHREQLGERARAGEVDAAPAALVVQVAVGKARRHEAAVEVDDLGARPGMRPHRAPSVPTAMKRPSLTAKPSARSERSSAVNTLAVDEHEVGRLGESCRCGEASQ